MVEWVSYYSRGNCLVIADFSSQWQALPAYPWPSNIQPYILLTREQVTEGAQLICEQLGIRIWAGCPREIRGHLGAFEVISLEGGNFAEMMGIATQRFDLILDLGSSPLLRREVLPPGYFSMPMDSLDTGSIVAELAEWVGTFDKPRYFSYQEQICAHGASGYKGCAVCLEACAADAIISEGASIRVDPYLCQGCGDCTSACPSGALNYVYPARDQFLAELRDRLTRLRDSSVFNEGVAVLVHEDTQSHAAKAFCEKGNGGILPVSVEALGSVGPEVWLAALAYGASAVWLLEQGVLNHTQANLQVQMQWVKEILAGLGYDPQSIRWVRSDQGNIEPPPRPNSPPAMFLALADKREMLRLALSHLTRYAPSTPAAIPLPAGSPFGIVTVDHSSCTLCMACVNVCPVNALHAGRDKPQLKFLEMHCVQCGLCERACPEGAIRLQPRYLLDWDRLRQPRVLHEEIPFNCLECGKPFATGKMIETVLARIGNHPVFAREHQRRRLMLCEECRVRDVMATKHDAD